MVFARVSVSAYGNQVLNVVKAKFNLNDKSDALNKFLELYGDDFVEKEASEEYIKKAIEIEERHLKKYGKRKMSLAELDKLCEA